MAYDYFCDEMENILHFRFGLKDTVADAGVTSTLEKEMLRSAITAVSHIVYLNRCFRLFSRKHPKLNNSTPSSPIGGRFFFVINGLLPSYFCKKAIDNSSFSIYYEHMSKCSYVC